MNKNLFRLVLGKLFSLEQAREQSPLDLPAEMAGAGAGLRAAAEILGPDMPRLPGKLFLLVDVSGSMQDPMPGHRDARMLDLAALFAATTLKRNSAAEVVAFSDEVIECELGPRDDIAGNALKLAQLEGGGTKCVAPLKALNKRWARGDLVVLISDNQSWPTAPMLAEWDRFKSRNKRAKLASIDIQPRVAQALEREDVLALSGFSAATLDLVLRFAEGRLAPEYSAA